MEENKQIFISFSSQDRLVTEKLVHDLRSLKGNTYRIWLYTEQSFGYGINWQDTIE